MQHRPDIEQFTRVLKRGKADFIPLAELGIHPSIKEKFIGRPIRTVKDDVEFWHNAGYDYIKLQPGAEFNPAAAGRASHRRTSVDGTITRDWAHEGKGVITGFADFENYRFPETSEFDYSAFDEVAALLPDGMGVIGQYGDIFTMTWNLMGFEGFSIALYEEPALVEALMNKLGGLVYGMFEYFAQNEIVDALWYSDDIAYAEGLMVSPAVLRQWFFPWLKKIGDLARNTGKPFIYHTDGVLYDVFEDIIACGVDAIHPIEPKAMEIREVAERVGDRLAILGNIDVDLLARGTPEQVRATAMDLIEDLGERGGYCLGSGNSIPDYVRFENYLAMIETPRALKEASS